MYLMESSKVSQICHADRAACQGYSAARTSHSISCLAMARAEGPNGHQLKIRHLSQLAVGVRDSDEWGLIESR